MSPSDWDAIKEIGSLAGIGSSLFLLWDRLVRRRPRVSFTLQLRGRDAIPTLCVRNPARESLLVTGIRFDPEGPTAFPGESARSIASAAAGKYNVLIEPESIHLFEITPYGRELPHPIYLLVLSWRSMRSPWLPQVPVFKLITPRAIQRIKGSMDHRGD